MKTYDELKALIEQRGVHELLGPVGQGWNLEQNPHELATFLARMQDLGVQSCLEIGTGYKGGLSRFLAQEIDYWPMVSIDIRDYGLNFHGVGYWILDLDRSMLSTNRGGKLWNIPIAKWIYDEYFDLVFIDGAHDYASVKSDYETYGKLATKVIAFHDIEGLRDCEGARDFWHEISPVTMPTGSTFDDLGLKITGYSTYDERNGAGIGWIELE